MGKKKIIAIGIIFIIGIILLVKGMLGIESGKKENPKAIDKDESSAMLTITKENSL